MADVREREVRRDANIVCKLHQRHVVVWMITILSNHYLTLKQIILGGLSTTKTHTLFAVFVQYRAVLNRVKLDPIKTTKNGFHNLEH